ncbi:hypothetical protein HWV62_19919 [Athelia sp. TMB]|nr:hypothetical protein HWV62_19919 [Athelia sp. TMB]
MSHHAYIDRDQKVVHQVEDGNRELVTVIECVSADGTSIPPSVVYQGARRDLEWGRDNPCGASISHSPKGWTDQELGSAWLEHDFEPATSAKNTSGGYRLLILDGHNSHTTYRFCNFAKKHKIIILCLPSHTTHCLQPCDVGVFGPLNSTWKSEVNSASSDWTAIRKHNLLSFYSRAREKAFTPGTIKSAFRKTGIWPFNRNAIPLSAYSPALNTTTQAAQPVPPQIPVIVDVVLTPTPSSSSDPISDPPLSSATSASRSQSTSAMSLSSSTSPSAASSSTLSSASRTSNDPSHNTGTTPPGLQGADRVTDSTTEPSVTTVTDTDSTDQENEVKFILKEVPKPLSELASRAALAAQNLHLRYLLDRACFQMEKDYAIKVLMDKENGRLRKKLFDKSAKKGKKTTGYARHMTSDEVLDALAREEWASAMKEVFKERVWRLRKQAYERYCRDMVAQEKAKLKEVERVRKDGEREEERRLKDLEKVQAQEARKRESNRKKAMRDEAKRRKAADMAAEREKRAGAAKLKRSAGRRDKAKGIAIARAVADENDELLDMERDKPGLQTPAPTTPSTPAPDSIPAPPRPRPRPRPRLPRRAEQIVTPEAAVGSSDGGRVSTGSDQAGDLPLPVPTVSQSEAELHPMVPDVVDVAPVRRSGRNGGHGR